MILHVRRLARINKSLNFPLETHVTSPVASKNDFCNFSTSHCPVECYPSTSNVSSDQAEKNRDFKRKYDAGVVIAKVSGANSENEVFQSLVSDPASNTIEITSSLIDRLLHRFQDDWKSALGIFRWVETCSGYEPVPELYDKLVDILGKMKQMEKMKALLEEMREGHLVSLNTIAKVMRRFAGAGDWKDAVKIFDELKYFGLEKNTESMNLLLDTLCKENKVEQARAIFWS